MNTQRLFRLSAMVGCALACLAGSVQQHEDPVSLALSGIYGLGFGAVASWIAWRYVAGPIARGQAGRTFRLWTAVGCTAVGLAAAAVIVWTWH